MGKAFEKSLKTNLFQQLVEIVSPELLTNQLSSLAKKIEEKTFLRNNSIIVLEKALTDSRALIKSMLEGDPFEASIALKAYTFVTDSIIKSILNLTMDHIFPKAIPTQAEKICVIAVGGYGRAEMAPYSDIDLLFITPYKQTAWGENVIETVLYILWDLKLKVGHSVRTVDDCLRLGLSDITIRTSLLENRYLAGEKSLAKSLNHRLWKELFQNTGSNFIEGKLIERDRRHKKQGTERYILEPNIKEGKGGLRDLQTLFWISKYIYKIECHEDLVKNDVFSTDELVLFKNAESFLWSVRCATHLLSKRANEHLTFDIQVNISKRLGFKNSEGLLAVEKFMQTYFLHAKNVGELTRIFLAAMEARLVKRKPTLINRLRNAFERSQDQFSDDFTITHGRLNISNPAKFKETPINLLRLFQAGLKSGRMIHPDALQLVARNLHLVDETFRKNEDAKEIFIDLLLNYNDPERALRRMNEVGILGKFIPDFERVVGMMQFNMYHKYTVDEHIIQCVKNLAQIEKGILKEDLPLVSKILARGINRKVLYLSILLHDIGKGLPEDHSIAGAKISVRVTKSLGLSLNERELIEWLILNHLLMSDVAQKRDISETKTVKDFARQVKSTTRLRLLTVLTVCDIRGVGPNVWNNWKAVLIRRLYSETVHVLNENYEAISRPEQLENAKVSLKKALDNWDDAKIQKEVSRHYPAYLLGLNTETQKIFAQLGEQLESNEIQTQIVTDQNRDASRACFLIEDHPGIFSRLAGAIALTGANVIDAKTYTTSDGFATAVFWLQNSDGAPFEKSRLKKLNSNIIQSLKGTIITKNALEQRGKIKKRERDFIVPTTITFDNDGSDIYTIIEIDTRDRLGLLHDLAKTLSNNNITIVSAIIATYGEQAVDTFYVKDLFGLKLYSEQKRKDLAEKIKLAIQDGTIKAMA